MSVSSSRFLPAAASDGTLRPVPFRRLVLCGSLCATVALGCSDGEAPTPTSAPASIQVTAPDSELALGQVLNFTATVLDSAGSPIPGASVTWRSIYPEIASVSVLGVVTARGVGEGTVLVTSSGVSGYLAFQVIDSSITRRVPLFGIPHGLAVSGNHALVTLLYFDSVAVLDVPAATHTRNVQTGYPPTGVAYNPAGTRAYVASQDGTITVLDGTSYAVLDTKQIPGTALTTVLVSPDGATVWVTADGRDRLYAMDAATLALTDSVATPSGPNWIARSPVQPRLYVNGSNGGTVAEFDATTLTPMRTWNLSGSAQGMVVSADGARLFVANEGGWLDVIALVPGTVQPQLPLGPAFGIALSPDGTRLAVGIDFSTVVILDAATMGTVKTVSTSAGLRRLAYTADGSRLLATAETGWVDYIR